ncbi:phage distal tail protein, Rcc01695 family [Oceanicaulis sp.]|uniref:phage distal tail protein, Rcc01695 family n=1 Tax=Oceanicaulis sp. TaxID=1924941 RepID=UPI003BACA4F1
MSAFHDVRFPLSIGLAARGGPERRTEIVTLNSGREERNAVWRDSRRRWDAAPGVRSQADLARLVAFFEARLGRLHAFRFTDPFDHGSAGPGAAPGPLDQGIGTGDGVSTRFQLRKAYGDGAGRWDRPITLPQTDSVRAAVDGVETPVSIAPRGEIVFDASPPDGALITAGYRFDVPTRFDVDALEASLETGAALIASIPLVEVRL